MSLRLRLAGLVGLAVFAVAALFGAGVYLVVATRLAGDVDLALQHQAQLDLRRLQFAPGGGRPGYLPGSADIFVIAYDASGRVVASSPNGAGLGVTPPAAAWQRALDGSTSFLTVQQGGTRLRLAVLPVPASSPTGPQAEVLVVGQSLQEQERTLDMLRAVMAVGGAAALAGAVLSGWLVAGRSLRPLADLTRAAQQLGDSADLRRRLPVPATGDELAGLAGAFNASLDRLAAAHRALEEALQRQRRFVGDASHELRSPLTVILNNAENLLDHPEANPEERAQCLGELVLEAKRMAQLSSDLLQLARGDADQALDIAPIDWDEFVAELSGEARRVCAPRPVTVEAASLGRGRADRGALLRAFRAVFDNVASHTPPTAAVTVRAAANAGGLRFSVADTGPGVSEEALPHIFDRFFRGDPSRRGQGTGLGLAIARSLLERHGGRISAHRPAEGGLELVLEVPRGFSSG